MRSFASLQFVRFALVGAGGYLVNITTFAVLTGADGIPSAAAASCAFLLAVAHNFVWNRRWTFRCEDGAVAPQGIRFLAVSLVGYGAALTALSLLTRVGLHPLPAQIVAVAIATPLNYAGNKLWTFRSRSDAGPVHGRSRQRLGLPRTRPARLPAVVREPVRHRADP